MEVTSTTSRMLRGWILCALVIFYAQNVTSKALLCGEKQYFKDSRCCNKCQPGSRVLSPCTESQQTVCSNCNHHEYQPGWTDAATCIPKKFCDTGKGFMSRNEKTESLETEEPCRCKPGYQCHLIHCEYCEAIPTCDPGYTLELENDSTSGRKVCAPCKNGFFSAGGLNEQCKPWRSCKAEGRSELKPGNAQADAMCGEHVSASPWVLVTVLLVITALCLLILLLFCYKDKLKLLSVNLRSCVQNLKRSRIQQETLGPTYHSGTVAESPRTSSPCETTKLICQSPHSPGTDSPSTVPSPPVSNVGVSPTSAKEMVDKEDIKEKMVAENGRVSGEPEELSEEEVLNAPLHLAGPCTCVVPVHEPLEVGENEDCSQAVDPGMSGTCSCGILEKERNGEKRQQNRKEENERGGQRPENISSSSNGETCVTYPVSVSSSLIHASSTIPISNPPAEVCVPLSQAAVRPQYRSNLSDTSPIKQEEDSRLANANSASHDSSSASATTLVNALMTSTSAGHLYLDKPSEASGSEKDLGVSSRDNKLSSGESELGCSPESLHSRLVEPSLTSGTSGMVSGNHNTTFISSGQVMNVSGDVIVVYVSPTSHSGEESGQGGTFGSPIQEQANETTQFFQSSLRPQGDSITHNTSQGETLPVQEVRQERQRGK
nr:tumor necrosis factor receptor superfamily member 11A [Nothobranchius furzeri]